MKVLIMMPARLPFVHFFERFADDEGMRRKAFL